MLNLWNSQYILVVIHISRFQTVGGFACQNAGGSRFSRWRDSAESENVSQSLRESLLLWSYVKDRKAKLRKKGGKSRIAKDEASQGKKRLPFTLFFHDATHATRAASRHHRSSPEEAAKRLVCGSNRSE